MYIVEKYKQWAFKYFTFGKKINYILNTKVGTCAKFWMNNGLSKRQLVQFS
jgi:hypothetical protein